MHKILNCFELQNVADNLIDFPNYDMPACFDRLPQWTQYIDLDDPFFYKIGYCGFCTPEYKNEMIKQNRCAHPQSQFYIIEYRSTIPEIDMLCIRHVDLAAYIIRSLYGKNLIRVKKYG